MGLKIYTAPAIEPVTLTEAKAHIRATGGTLADNLDTVQSIAPGSHAIASAYSLKGTGLEVLNYSAVVMLISGTNVAGGTVDVKLQESDTDTDLTYADVASGAFTQLTTANDNATYEKAYTGTKRYIRVVSTVAGNACEFGVSVARYALAAEDDNLITALIVAAREQCEAYQNRALITQIWDLYLDAFPENDQAVISIPKSPLQSVGSVTYLDSSGTLQTWSSTKYRVDTTEEPARLSLEYGEVWPTTRGVTNSVIIRFTAGYGTTAASVPYLTRQAMLMLIGYWYSNREALIERKMLPNVYWMLDTNWVPTV